MTFRCYACDAEITFSPQFVSENGKPIPLELYGAPHSCPSKNQRWKNKNSRNNKQPILRQSDYGGKPSPTTTAIDWSGDRVFQEIRHVYDRLNALEVRIEALERELFLYLQRHKREQQEQREEEEMRK